MKQTKILAVKTHALGDLLLVTPALHRLRTAFPDAQLTLLTTRQCAPLLHGNPDIDELIELSALSFGPSSLKTIFRIMSLRADKAVIFQASRSARLSGFLAGAKEMVWLTTERGTTDDHALPWPPDPNTYTADAYQELVSILVPDSPIVASKPRLFVKEDEKTHASRFLQEMGHQQERYVVVAPGGGRNLREAVPEKLWPSLRFSEIVCELHSRFGMSVVLVGGAGDREIAAEVTRNSPVRAVNTVGKTSLRMLAAIVDDASLVVTNDSLVLHMAVALERPLVGLFGPTSSANFLPQVGGKAVAISSETSCSPCFGNSLFPGCRIGKAICMENIPVQKVLRACEDIAE